MDDSFVKAPVNVPKLSGFDKSHQNLLTTKCGTITPILIDELIPGSKVHLKLALSASLPPLASDTFMRCSVKVEAFFCPLRLLAGSFESWFTDSEKRFAPYSSSTASYVPVSRKGYLPCIGGFDITDSDNQAAVAAIGAAGGLFDYLGFKAPDPTFLSSSVIPVSVMPALCYHRVYHDWYRNSLVQSDVFLPPTAAGSSSISPGSTLPYLGLSPYLFYQGDSSSSTYGPYYLINHDRYLLLADGKKVYELRQRNFGLDYFTTGTPSPQQGSAETVTFSTSGSTGQFSIAALRAANSLQQFKERNNLAGNLFVEQCYARYGVSPSDGVAQRSLYLGSAEYEVYTKGIYQQTDGGATSSATNNPFGKQVGAQFGTAKATGNSTLIDTFEAKEPGYLLVNATLVPRVTYSTGIHRRFTNYCGAGSLSDLANPILQNVGPQPIYQYELNGAPSSSVFAYTDRYASFKTMEDELHGLVRDGQTLESFALQRSIASTATPTISSSFLEIPTNYMDQVTVVDSQISSFGCWMDCYFDYKVAQPLAKYSLPSLQDPAYEHGRTIVVHKGGSRL